MIVDHVMFQGKSVQTRMDVHELFGPVFEGVSPDMPMHLARIHSKVSNVLAYVQALRMPCKVVYCRGWSHQPAWMQSYLAYDSATADCFCLQKILDVP